MAGDVLGRLVLGVKAAKGSSTIGAYYGLTTGDAGRQNHAFKIEMRYAFQFWNLVLDSMPTLSDRVLVG